MFLIEYYWGLGRGGMIICADKNEMDGRKFTRSAVKENICSYRSKVRPFSVYPHPTPIQRRYSNKKSKVIFSWKYTYSPA